ncbi:MAG: GFA family protein [Hyphomicrobium sp.]|jgi:hypothetical protein
MKIAGGCNCGNVRYELDGEPTRIGLCHCETCRKETGSAFSYFGIWPRQNARMTGETRSWGSKAGGRHFCPTCGSSVFGAEDSSDEIEIKLGTLDQPPSSLRPKYELWIIRREHWLSPLPDNEQHERDRI